MREIGDANANEVVLAFLRAEAGSSKYGPSVLERLSGRVELLEEPDLRNDEENSIRIQVLGEWRGYGRDTHLFAGFPSDVTWKRVELSRSEVQELLLGRGLWSDISDDTRSVAEAAQTLTDPAYAGDERTAIISAIAERDRAGAFFEPLIVVSPPSGSPRVLVEGYKRACAYAWWLGGPDVEAFHGRSPYIADWSFWNTGR
jgi:hypothetical protein